LKPEYHAQALKNLASAVRQGKTKRAQSLFAEVEQ
jgi:hypothetical protein